MIDDANKIAAELKRTQTPTQDQLYQLCRVAMQNNVVHTALSMWAANQCTFAQAMAQAVITLADANESLIKKMVAAELARPIVLTTEAEMPKRKKGAVRDGGE